MNLTTCTAKEKIHHIYSYTDYHSKPVWWENRSHSSCTEWSVLSKASSEVCVYATFMWSCELCVVIALLCGFLLAHPLINLTCKSNDNRKNKNRPTHGHMLATPSIDSIGTLHGSLNEDIKEKFSDTGWAKPISSLLWMSSPFASGFTFGLLFYRLICAAND